MTKNQLLRLIICISFFTISADLFSQNFIGVAPWDNALSYNPSLVGVHTEESIQMNIHLVQNLRRSFDTTINPRSAVEFINFRDEVPSPLNINRSYFLGYQKTVPLKGNFRLTGGVHLQGYHWALNTIQDANSLGLTVNFHYAIFKREHSHSHLSLGYQHNILFQTPNVTASKESYDTFIAPTLSLEDYSEQFRNQGASQSLSFNYSYVRKKETLITIGGIIHGYKYKLVDDIDSSLSGKIDFKNANFSLPRINVEFQQVFHDKFVLEAHGIVGFESQVAAGLGFRVKKHNLVKLLVVSGILPIEGEDSSGAYTSLNVSLEMKRYKYIASAGVSIIRFAKLGVVYRFENRDTSSLISLGN